MITVRILPESPSFISLISLLQRQSRVKPRARENEDWG
jgi:hypothetical protein